MRKEFVYGAKTDYRKIDIYAKGPISPRYLCSTTWAPNLRIARERCAMHSSYAASDLVAYYSERQ